MSLEQPNGHATPPEPLTPALLVFSAELAQRFPKREIKRFVLPTPITQCREIFIRELGTRDVIEAATMADALMSGLEKASKKLSDRAEERETHRLSVVGIGETIGDAVAYRHINASGIPFAEMTDWPKRVWDVIELYFNQVNGLPWEEVGKGIKEARTVGAFAPPTSATLASAEPGRSAA